MAVINEHGGLWKRATSVVLLRAMDFDDAFAVACEVGHGMEETYVNGDDDGVRWAFERVMTLDMLPEDLTSGTEVYSEPTKAVARPRSRSTRCSPLSCIRLSSQECRQPDCSVRPHLPRCARVDERSSAELPRCSHLTRDCKLEPQGEAPPPKGLNVPTRLAP